MRGALALAVLLMAPAVHAGSITIHVTTTDGDPLPAAVVTAVSTSQIGSVPAKTGTKAVMVQEHKQFSPYVLPIQIGTTVAFPNRDPFRHQVYSFSPAKLFELKLYGSSEVSTVTFDKEGTVALGCNIHDNMLAYIHIVGTPHFAATVANGDGKIEQLPAGTYIVKVWHPNQKGGETDAGTLKVGATDTVDAAVKIAVKRGRAQRKPGASDEIEY